MRQLFTTPFRITQAFGVNPDYYKQFGLKAHEGLDCVPTGSERSVKALADGVVSKDIDNPKSGAYGINVTIYHPTLKKQTQYCHLQLNNVSIGQKVKAGDTIGIMGGTGNTNGDHVHLNLFETDNNGNRLNTNNGYFGGINPLPFLEENPESEDELTRKEALETLYDSFYPGNPGGKQSWVSQKDASGIALLTLIKDEMLPGKYTDDRADLEAEVQKLNGLLEEANNDKSKLTDANTTLQRELDECMATDGAIQPPPTGTTPTPPTTGGPVNPPPEHVGDSSGSLSHDDISILKKIIEFLKSFFGGK